MSSDAPWSLLWGQLLVVVFEKNIGCSINVCGISCCCCCCCCLLGEDRASEREAEDAAVVMVASSKKLCLLLIAVSFVFRLIFCLAKSASWSCDCDCCLRVNSSYAWASPYCTVPSCVQSNPAALFITLNQNWKKGMRPEDDHRATKHSSSHTP